MDSHRGRSLAVVVLLALTLSGCSGQQARRFLYEVGDQYACTALNNERLAERGRNAACADPGHPSRSSFDDYDASRNAELGNPTS